MAVISLTDYEPRPRWDDNPWISARAESTTDLETWDLVEEFDFSDPDEDPINPVVRNFTFVLFDDTATHVRIVFLDDDGNQDITDPVSLVEPTVLATVSDVQVRLGRNLTEAQEAQVSMLLNAATTSILNVADKDASWTPPTQVKQLLSMLCVEIVCRSMSNPMALGAESETLGSYSRSTTYAREVPGSGLILMPVEEMLVRRAVWGAVSGSGKAASLPDVAPRLLPLGNYVLDETVG